MFKTFDALVRRLAPLTLSASATLLHPSGYFLARSGVMTLAFTGFPGSLLELKDAIEKALPGLAPEHAGSRWPKVTLGALRTPAPLSKDEMERLRELADRAALALADCPPIRVTELELVAFQCRSLERRTHSIRLPLQGLRKPDSATIPEDHAAEVHAVQKQFRWDRLDGYHPDVVRPGYREAHYRNPYHEFTLVYPLPPVIPGLDRFLEDVDRLLPERYAWFDADSRHVTIRTLGPEPPV